MSAFLGRDYNFALFSESRREFELFRTLTHAGDLAPDFTLPSLDGREVTLSALRGKPVHLEFSCITNHIAESEFAAADAMAREFSEVQFLFIYVRETHPEYLPGGFHKSFEEKFELAKQLQARENTPRPILVDDLDGSVHRAYSGMADMSWLIDAAGCVAYKASWMAAGDLRAAIESTLANQELDRSYGTGPMSRFYRETLFSLSPVHTRLNEAKLAQNAEASR